MSLIVVEAIRGRCASFMILAATVSEIFGGQTNSSIYFSILDSTSGFEINARPLARGDWKPRGMSRIFAQVVRRASGYFNLFCQLCVTTNETNY